MSAIASEVFNRGHAPAAFIQEMVEWARTAKDEIFDRTPTVGTRDIYNKVHAELGPYGNLTHRKGVMLEVLRVLAGFESSWDWTEGVDASRRSATNAENAEAGAWQVSYDSRRGRDDLTNLLFVHGISNGSTFQAMVKTNHEFAMEYEARLLRLNTKHNGPLYKGEERRGVWPDRPKLWRPEESLYPWLKRDAVAEFVALLG